MDIFSFLKDSARSLIYTVQISTLIDDKKLNRIDGRRILPSILRNSNLTQTDKTIIIKRKKKINQQNALKAFRQREKDENRKLTKELSDKQREKQILEIEKQILQNEIQELLRKHKQ